MGRGKGDKQWMDWGFRSLKASVGLKPRKKKKPIAQNLVAMTRFSDMRLTSSFIPAAHHLKLSTTIPSVPAETQSGRTEDYDEFRHTNRVEWHPHLEKFCPLIIHNPVPLSQVDMTRRYRSPQHPGFRQKKQKVLIDQPLTAPSLKRKKMDEKALKNSLGSLQGEFFVTFFHRSLKLVRLDSAKFKGAIAALVINVLKFKLLVSINRRKSISESTNDG